MSKVEFNTKNLEKCICKTCPVQAESSCVKEKNIKVQEMMEENMMPEPEMVPGLYCASGKAACSDLDTAKMCQCNECPLWDEYDLPEGLPMGYYCRDGEAQ
ncbi:DUF2769 domain-containing protein [Methanobacterium alkalithermotolerans]|uniref:DUF2769 domain-containing protein n=1 Tax=Methanobacterium alkalithermotolerans TaxID=2731220 RepID=A0A8T8KAE9_9EURY|nr:DUF2769 domain-containing protein [Methanobacterium alkalithermotolerans]RJS48271.1 MAG: DUF2769 domain-containing protein [Methanobacterium sp.]